MRFFIGDFYVVVVFSIRLKSNRSVFVCQCGIHTFLTVADAIFILWFD